MKKILLLLFQFPILIFCQHPTTDKNWNATPIFDEEFVGIRSWDNNRKDNTGTWYAYWTECGVIHLPEFQVYQRENALFNTPTSGYLTLRAEYRPNTDTSTIWYPFWTTLPKAKWDYFSGAIESVRKFKYGYFEIRCALPPANKGNFPAFWLWEYINRYSEIDIFEHTIHGKVSDERCFTGGYYTSNGIGENRVNYDIPLNEPGLTNFHTYAVEWSPKSIIWYFDNKQVGSARNEPEITDESMAIKVNYALDDYVKGANNSLFPLNMVIDYVKVYQLKCDKLTIVNEISNFSTFNYAVKKSISLSGATTIPANSNISLRATDFIELTNGFEVPLGVELYLDITPCDNTTRTKKQDY